MTKRIHIQESFDYHYYVIGIASDAHIWKLCWEINQQLNLSLVNKEKEAPEPVGLNRAEEVLATLFKQSQIKSPAHVQHYYEDVESDRLLEYALFEADKSLSPKAAKPFRYFLLIRAAEPSMPDMATMINQLNQCSAILSSVDISDIKNIKNIIL